MILTFRFISDEEESFVLDLNINHDQSFLQMHQKIQETLGYDASQMSSFFISNQNWEKLNEITLIDMGYNDQVQVMSDTLIGDYFSATKQNLLYVFDLFAERLLFASVTRVIDAEPPIELPSVSKFEGNVPPQNVDEQEGMYDMDDEEFGYDEDEEEGESFDDDSLEGDDFSSGYDDE